MAGERQDEPAGPRRYREVAQRVTGADLRTLAGFLLVVLAGLVAASVAERTLGGLDDDVRAALAALPRVVTPTVVALVLVGYLLLVVAVPVALVVRGRLHLLLRGAVAVVASGLVLALVLVLPNVQLVREALGPAATGWSLGPSSSELAAIVAVTVVARPSVRRGWTTGLWALAALVGVVRVASATAAPIDVVFAIGVGGAVGAAVLVVLGRSVLELTPAGLVAVLDEAGLRVHDLRPLGPDDAPWDHAGVGDSGPVAVSVVDEREWQADRLRRGYRRVRLRGTGDEEPFPSPMRAVTAEAMATLFAATRGVAVLPVLAVAPAPEGEAILAVGLPAGRRLDQLRPAELTDEVLRAAWRQVGLLREARLAHRELDLHHLLLGDERTVHVLHLTRAEPAAAPSLLAGDVAELLAATAAVVGPRRAVAACRDMLGADVVGQAVARLVPVALGTTTRAALGRGLGALVQEASSAAGIDEPTFEKVERLRPRTLLVAAMLAVAVYVLAPQVADLPQLLETVRAADLRWVPLVVLASALTYLGAAIGLAGGTPGRVPIGEAASVALASSFVATFSPPGVVQVGMNVRYLQKRGFPTAVAASASAAKEAAVLVAHLLLLIGFAWWAGSSDALSDELQQLPPVSAILAAAGGLLVLVGVVAATPRVRRQIRDRVLPAVRSSAEAMREVTTRPAKLALLLGGVTLLPLGYAVCLYASVRAFDPAGGFVTIALVSLTAGAVATAAPTPGGVGAVEAVLLAALTGIGVPASAALASVVLYRLATFWAPVLPGLVAFRVLTHRDVL